MYLNSKGEKVAFHVQATLTKGLRELMKSPWQRSLHIIDSIYDTQPNFKDIVDNRTIYGIRAKLYLDAMAKWQDCASFD